MNIQPKYSIGQQVFIYESGKLKPKTIDEILTRERSLNAGNKVVFNIEYHFRGDERAFISVGGTDESEVFLSKEEFIEWIKKAE